MTELPCWGHRQTWPAGAYIASPDMQRHTDASGSYGKVASQLLLLQCAAAYHGQPTFAVPQWLPHSPLGTPLHPHLVSGR